MSKNFIKIQNFNRLKVNIDYEPIMEEYGNKAKNTLKQTSPRTNKNRKKGHYADGWVAEKSKLSNNQYVVKVWNAKHWQLTHLLENGHLIVNKKSGIGWSPARAHIAPAYEKYKNQYIHAMQNADIKVDLN